MNKPFLVTACCLVLAVLLLKSASTIDWKIYLQGALNRTIDTVEDAYLRLMVKNPALYKSFKKQSDAFKKQSDDLQAAINKYLEAYERQGDKRYLVQARTHYEKLRQEHVEIRRQAKEKLDPKDYRHLEKELKRNDQLFKRLGGELGIHASDEDVTVQAMTAEVGISSIDRYATKERKKLIKRVMLDTAKKIKTDLLNLTKQYATRQALDRINTHDFNPKRFLKGVVVDRSKKLHKNETLLINSLEHRGLRLGKAAGAQEQLFMEKVVPKKYALRIGIAFSGGGYRAMILSLGYAIGLAKMGIWDATSYISTLSGSTWFLSVLMKIAEENNGADSITVLEKTLDHFINKIKADTFALTKIKSIFGKDALSSFANNVLWPNFLFDRPFRSVDIYGGLLAQTLLSGLSGDPQIHRLSDEWNTIKDGDWPFPIRTAVTMMKENDDYKYHWLEFNPNEVRDIETDLAIPIYSLGRKFDAGSSVNMAPEEKMIVEYGPEIRLSALMGIWGSAFTANLGDFQMMMESYVAGSILDKAKKTVALRVLKALEKDTPIGNKRLSPAQVNNPFKMCGSDKCPKAVGSWLSEKDFLTIIDGGIEHNTPLSPLFKKQRELDVIIVGDSSGDIETPAQLDLFFKYIKNKEGFDYERFDNKTNSTFSVWRVKDNPKAPLIIYINFKNDAGLMKKAKEDLNLKALMDKYNLEEFDYKKALAGYASTFNWDYKLKQFLQLCGMGEFNMRANKKVIMNLLRELFDKKRPEKDVEEEIILGE